MLLIVTAAGILGSILLGLRGLGSGGELDRIFAIACLFAAAAGALGTMIDDRRRDVNKPAVLTREERMQLVVAAPLALLMIGVFLITLIPSVYVLLPGFAVWRYATRHRPEPSPIRVHEPALAH